MNEFYKLYLPKSKREVRIEISIPKYRNHISFDTLYFLDGQNAFSDTRATFGRSIRATKHLNFAAKEMGKRIIGVAIHNSGTDMGRVNEYSPFKIDFFTDKWRNNDVTECFNFCDDLVNTIVPFIESKYDVRPNPENRYIYGSSLAAVTAIYTAFKYPNSFNYVGAFSTASFLFEEAFYKFLTKNINHDKKVFLYCGKEETSDQMTLNSIYEDSTFKLYNFFKENNIKTRVVISTSGEHNEETWDKNFLDFINFVYYDDVIFKK